jgi:hypothetical protein
MIDHHKYIHEASAEDFDRILDEALAKYVAIEPRDGLEERVLANLQAQKQEAAARGWLTWLGAAVASAGMIIVAVLLMLRTGRPTHDNGQRSTAPQIKQSVGSAKIANNDANGQSPAGALRVGRKKPQAVSSKAKFESIPRLDQFPSRQPLSAQEQILAMYVARFHPQAVLLAELRAEEMRRDREEDARKWREMLGPDSKQ